jgi:hypothetical protein
MTAVDKALNLFESLFPYVQKEEHSIVATFSGLGWGINEVMYNKLLAEYLVH